MRLTYKAQDQNGKETGTVWYASIVEGSIFPKSDKEEQVLKKLAAYEDAEAEGRLVRLPCKAGDTVYRIVRHRVDVSGYRMEWEWETAVEAVPFRIGMVDAIGKTVFLSREKAEAALKGGTEDV